MDFKVCISKMPGRRKMLRSIETMIEDLLIIPVFEVFRFFDLYSSDDQVNYCTQ